MCYIYKKTVQKLSFFGNNALFFKKTVQKHRKNYKNALIFQKTVHCNIFSVKV